MSVLRADYFDGRTSAKHAVSVILAAGKLKIVGREVAAEFDARRVRRSLRVADTPRWLYLPGGGACVTTDNDGVDRLTRQRSYERTLLRWESRPVYAGLAAVLAAAAFWLIVDFGLPAAAAMIAARIPLEAEAVLGRETLAGMDRYAMRPSQLPAARQAALRAKLAAMTRAAGEAAPYRLEFRASPGIGANAFALPSGIVVVTDELVRLAKNDGEVLAVLAHELGHLHHRHAMRRLLEASATGLVVAGITGDVASASSLMASAPTVLLQSKYSRDNEREADRYAIEMLRKAGASPRAFGDILARMEAKSRGGGVPAFLSSHPATEERKALAGAAGLDTAAEAAAEVPRLVALDPAQREVLALLEARNYDGLERVLGGYQRAFERDPAASAPLENAYRAFGKAPGSAQAVLEEWTKRSPVSYPAALAKGSFDFYQELEARDAAGIAGTPKENPVAMRAGFERARASLARSLGLTPKPYLSRRLLMALARYSGSRGDEQAQYLEGLKFAPGSVELRLARMTGLEPRWGGSYAEMQAFLEEARPQLTALEAARLAARIPADRALERAAARDWAQALKYYDEAIALDAAADALCGRSRVQTELKRPAEALADAKLALSRTREDRACLQQAVRAAENADDPNEAVAVLSQVLEADPASAAALNQRGFAYEYLGKAELARRDYAAAADLGDPWAQQQLDEKKK